MPEMGQVDLLKFRSERNSFSSWSPLLFRAIPIYCNSLSFLNSIPATGRILFLAHSPANSGIPVELFISVRTIVSIPAASAF